jgi:hypothetical protein
MGTTEITDLTKYEIVENQYAFIQTGNHNSVGHASEPIGYPCHPRSSDCRFQVQSAGTLGGSCTDVPGATSGMVIPTSDLQRLYRLH